MSIGFGAITAKKGVFVDFHIFYVPKCKASHYGDKLISKCFVPHKRPFCGFAAGNAVYGIILNYNILKKQ